MINDKTLYGHIRNQMDLEKFKVLIGSTNVSDKNFLVADDKKTAVVTISDPESEEGGNQLLENMLESDTNGEIDLDEIMVCAAHAGKLKGVNAANLSKIWCIDMKASERTIDVTTQNSKRTKDPNLSHNYVTNDRMIRYKQIQE